MQERKKSLLRFVIAFWAFEFFIQLELFFFSKKFSPNLPLTSTGRDGFCSRRQGGIERRLSSHDDDFPHGFGRQQDGTEDENSTRRAHHVVAPDAPEPHQAQSRQLRRRVWCSMEPVRQSGQDCPVGPRRHQQAGRGEAQGSHGLRVPGNEDILYSCEASLTDAEVLHRSPTCIRP